MHAYFLGAEKIQRSKSCPPRLWGVVMLLCAVGCASSAPPKAANSAPTYDADFATLYSDLFRPELFGVASANTMAQDGLLSERIARAEGVVPTRVVTINREVRAGRRSYSVVVEQIGPELVGRSLSQQLSLVIPERSPTFAWLEGAGPNWVGTRLLLMFRVFHDGPHFFGTHDTPEVRGAIQDALQRQAAARKPPPT